MENFSGIIKRNENFRQSLNFPPSLLIKIIHLYLCKRNIKVKLVIQIKINTKVV